jgi:DNA-binding NtrC family response regulator
MLNILIVDDHLDLYPWLETSVTDEGRTIYKATTREEALRLISLLDFDVVVTDLELENKVITDGFDVLNAAKEKDPYTEVIVVTGPGNFKDGIKAMALGAFDYMQKRTLNIDVPAMLRAKVNKALTLRLVQLQLYSSSGSSQ